MRRSLAFVLLIGYLPALGGAGDLLKLPLLIGHYQEHCNRVGPTAFTAFLYMHYVEETGTDADQPEDQRLPFKSAEIISVAQQPLLHTPAAQWPEKKIYCLSDRFPLYHHNGCYDHYLARIWQPPRSC